MKLKIIFFLAIVFAVSNVSSQSYQWWSARYSSPTTGSQDTSKAITIDPTGNVYVAGWVDGFSSGTDIILLKYNGITGDTLWVRQYTSPGSNEDKALAITSDNAGFVYLTGYSFQPSRDIITIKYDGAGNQQWVSTFNGSNNGGDYGLAIKVDAIGNVYVAGRSDDAGNQHFTALKYNSLGVQQWASVYNGSFSGSFDQADAIAIDNSGNVYLTGFTSLMQNLITSDYLTVKYNSTGNLQWAKRYNGTGNDEDAAVGILAVNDAVYVTGRSDSLMGNFNFITFKYSAANGDSLESAYYSGTPLRQIDNPVQMTADNNGNIYVTGYSKGVLNTFDYATVKYNSNLQTQWESRYEGAGMDIPSDIVTSGSNVYVTGSSDGVTSKDYLTIRYNVSGAEQWVMRYNGPAGENDFASSLAVDQFENIFVTGFSAVSLTENDIITIRYSPVPLSIQPVSGNLPVEFKLHQNYPNPFNPSTNIRIDIPTGDNSNTKLEIYDVLGRQITTLVNENLKPGMYIVNWNASGIPSGIFFYKLTSGSFTKTNKMIMIK